MTIVPPTVPEAQHVWRGPAGVFRQLEGSWRISRRITPGGFLRGTCDATLRNDGALLAEEYGELVLDDGRRVASGRCLVYTAEPTGFSVWFAEDPLRPFHTVFLEPTRAGLSGTAAYLCGEDRYDSAYLFAPDGSFRIRHAVRGPRKSYVSETTFVRQEGCAPPDGRIQP